MTNELKNEMRSFDEIERVLELLSSLRESLDWKGDNFKWGFWLGKVTALGWVLKEEQSGEMGIHYDFEDWQREAKITADRIKQFLRENPLEQE